MTPTLPYARRDCLEIRARSRGLNHLSGPVTSGPFAPSSSSRSARELAICNLAIDGKLRGCDLAALRSDDVAPNGYAIDRANVRQRKTGRSVRFELTEPTRQAVDDYLRGADRKSGEYLFPGLGIRAGH